MSMALNHEPVGEKTTAGSKTDSRGGTNDQYELRHDHSDYSIGGGE
jgi:hypothetical protein